MDVNSILEASFSNITVAIASITAIMRSPFLAGYRIGRK
jgi:hypothetical protein